MRRLPDVHHVSRFIIAHGDPVFEFRIQAQVRNGIFGRKIGSRIDIFLCSDSLNIYSLSVSTDALK
jgi:hypothetical protein